MNEVQTVAVDQAPPAGASKGEAPYMWLTFGTAAVFATCRFPQAVPGLLYGFFFGGPAGAVERLTHDSVGIDWLIAFVTYPIIGVVFGSIKRLFRPVTLPKWMFYTTVTLAVLYLAETVLLLLRHRG